MAITMQDAARFAAAAVCSGKKGEHIITDLTDARLTRPAARRLVEEMARIHQELGAASVPVSEQELLKAWSGRGPSLEFAPVESRATSADPGRPPGPAAPSESSAGAGCTALLVTAMLAAAMIGGNIVTRSSLPGLLILAATAIWAAIDSSNLELHKYNRGTSGPVVVFLVVALLWIIFFPLYLVMRARRLSGELTLKKKYRLETWPKYEGKCYPLVVGVPAGSLAGRLGVKVDDLALSYNGKSLSDVSRDELRSMAATARTGPSRTVEATFFGGGGVVTHQVPKADSLGLRLKFPGE